MGISHIALAVKDIEKTHRFYTEAMGFELAKVEVVPHKEGGFARHVFYTTGSPDDQLIAFWDFSNIPNMGELNTDISRGLGFEPLTNHIAFQARDRDDLERRKERWLEFGNDVLEIDHHWIYSVYTEDPDGITVEFAVLTQPFTDADAAQALELLQSDTPPPSDPPLHKFHRARDRQ